MPKKSKEQRAKSKEQRAKLKKLIDEFYEKKCNLKKARKSRKEIMHGTCIYDDIVRSLEDQCHKVQREIAVLKTLPIRQELLQVAQQVNELAARLELQFKCHPIALNAELTRHAYKEAEQDELMDHATSEPITTSPSLTAGHTP